MDKCLKLVWKKRFALVVQILIYIEMQKFTFIDNSDSTL